MTRKQKEIWKQKVKDYMKEVEDIEKVAVHFGVHSNTVRNILNGYKNVKDARQSVNNE